MALRRIGLAAVSVAVCELAGLSGSVFTMPNIPGWYATLAKPFFTPPNWVFAPAWTILYALMGIAAYLVWAKGIRSRAGKLAISVFIVQFALNIAWSASFFGLNSILYGAIVVVLLWVSVLSSMLLFRRVSRLSFYVMLPYLAWVTFAAALNLSLLLLN